MSNGTTVYQRLGPASRAVLQLVACCPRIPTDVASQLLGYRRPGPLRQVLSRMKATDLIQVETVRSAALIGRRSIRLWSLTSTGRAVLTQQRLAPSAAELGLLPYGAPSHRRDPARQALPALIAAYHLLGEFVATINPRPRIRAWEQPWVRDFRADGRSRVWHAKLPAAAFLESGSSSSLPVLMLPDLGTSPVASYRSIVSRLLNLRQAKPRMQEPLLVIATGNSEATGSRAEAWRRLLQRVALSAGESPLRTQILPWPAQPGVPSRRTVTHQRGQLDHVLGLVARHRLLTRTHLAALLETSPARIGSIQTSLIQRGWLRRLDGNDLSRVAVTLYGVNVSRLGLVELTRAGSREAARQLMLSGPQAMRHHGHRSAMARRHMLRHPAHTIGANAVFVAMVRTSQLVRLRGGGDALEEWRSAAACARMHCRPDGYGCYRRGESRFGFFLEYDRGTERAGEYAAKLAAYYRYRENYVSTRDYVGFPTVLVVTTSEAAEKRISRQAYIASDIRGGEPLRILLTTTGLINSHPEGILGPIWRGPGPPGRPIERIYWLPGGPPHGLFGVGRGVGFTPLEPTTERSRKVPSWPFRAR